MRLALLEPRQPRTQLILPDRQLLAAPVGDEHRFAVHTRRQGRTIAFDHQPARRVLALLGGNRDQSGVIFLVAALDQHVVRDPADRSGRQADHIIGRGALRIVETIVAHIDLNTARLEIMAAAALFETRAGDDDTAVNAGVDAVRAAQPAVAAAEAREGRPVDGQRRLGIVSGKDAFLAVAEQAVGDFEVAFLQPDARAIAVGHAHVLEHDPVDLRARAAQYQRRLALAGHTVEDRTARFGGDEGDAPR